MAEPSGPGEEASGAPSALMPVTWKTARKNLLLFVATAVSILVTQGPAFTLALLAILLAHEFGHYFAARYHRVPASLPYFIPLPLISFFGTLGAVIVMPARIRSRNALVDIGASGPLAGLVVALPLLLFGLAHSQVSPSVPPYTQEGQSLIYIAAKYLVLGPIPAGFDVQISGVAAAAWAGLFLTMINLIPYGQLDGGHIAYAIFGNRQHTYARWIRRALPFLFLYNLAVWLVPMLRGKVPLDVPLAISNSLFWLVWFLVLGLLARFSGRDHPPCEPSELTPARRAIGWLSLVLFVGLFMPSPIAQVP